MPCEDEILVPLDPSSSSTFLMRNGGNRMTASFASVPGTKASPGIIFQGYPKSGFFVQDNVIHVTQDGILSLPLVPTVFINQTVTGDIDGVNDEFELSHEPAPNSLLVWVDDQKTMDYTLTGTTLTLGSPPAISSVVNVYGVKNV